MAGRTVANRTGLSRRLGRPGPQSCSPPESGRSQARIPNKRGLKIHQIKYLNNTVEQNHRAIKRLVWPIPGFKSFRSAAVTLAGIELMHMIQKGQLLPMGKTRPARRFYSLVG
jgi:putative transposase